MRWILIGIIHFYRLAVRRFYQRVCLFDESCSVHIERVARTCGFTAGLAAMRARIAQCRCGYVLNADKTNLICADGTALPLTHISMVVLKELQRVSANIAGGGTSS